MIQRENQEKVPTSNGTKITNHKGVSYLDRTLWICNTLFHQSFAVIGVFILWTLLYYNKINSNITWHYVLTTVAYVPLMGEAIILFSTDNLWSQKITRTQKYAIHGAVLFVSAVLATVGMAFIVNAKTQDHFVSIHAWTGLVSWIFVLASQILGLAAAKTDLLPHFVRPVYIKFIHNLFGQLGYVFGVVSLCYGLEKGGFSRHSTRESRLASYWILGITTFWSLLAALKSGYSQLKTIVT